MDERLARLLWWYTRATGLRVELEACPWWRPRKRRRLEASYRRACLMADAERNRLVAPGVEPTSLDELLTSTLEELSS